MSKLREKFTEWMRKPSVTNEYDISTLEQITDDFSVSFLEWKDKLQLESKIGLMDRGFSIYMESGKEPISVTTTELLQIFKEKYYE